MSAEIFVANESAVLFAAGQQYVIHKGTTRVRAGHPLLKRNAHLFEPIDVHFDVEQATSVPGEKRTRSKGRGKDTEPVSEERTDTLEG